MSKHTPGPWKTGLPPFEDEVFAETLIPDADDWGPGFICETAGNKDNARLIAAAPDLLAELELIVQGWLVRLNDPRLVPITPWEQERLEFARETIAKAKGE